MYRHDWEVSGETLSYRGKDVLIRHCRRCGKYSFVETEIVKELRCFIPIRQTYYADTLDNLKAGKSTSLRPDCLPIQLSLL